MFFQVVYQAPGASLMSRRTHDALSNVRPLPSKLVDHSSGRARCPAPYAQLTEDVGHTTELDEEITA